MGAVSEHNFLTYSYATWAGSDSRSAQVQAVLSIWSFFKHWADQKAYTSCNIANLCKRDVNMDLSQKSFSASTLLCKHANVS